MTTYDSQTTVTIAGTDYSDETLRGVRISMGRDNLQEQPSAGYANIQIFSDWNTPLTFDVNDSVVVKIWNPHTSAMQAVFTGRVSEVTVDVQQSGLRGGVAVYSILAFSALAALSRKTAGTVETFTDTDPATMVAYWAERAFAFSWAQLPPEYSWNSFGVLTWNDLLNAGEVGTFEPTNWLCDWHTATETNALELCQLAANSALGVLHETADGTINFYGSNYRSVPALAFTLSAGIQVVPDITSALRVGELITESETFTSFGTSWGKVTGASIDTYGVYSSSRETLLDQNTLHPVSGEYQSLYQDQLIIGYRSIPYQYPDSFTIQLENTNFDDTERDHYMGVFCGLWIAVSGLPTTLWPSGTFTGYVEGWTWVLTNTQAELTMTVSDARLNIED